MLSQSHYLLLLLAGLSVIGHIGHVNATCKLPEYVVPCKLRDANFSQCALKHAKIAVPHILTGDRKFKVPPFEPLEILKITVDNSGRPVGLSLTMDDAKIHGLTNAVINEIRFDPDRKHAEFHVNLPKISIISNYNISGRVLLLPIRGYGPGNLTLIDTKIVYKMDYKLEKRKDKEFMVITHYELDFDNKKAYILMDNLFKDDPILSANSDRFIQENERELVDQLGPSVAEGIASAINHIIKQFTQCAPYDEIFLQ